MYILVKVLLLLLLLSSMLNIYVSATLFHDLMTGQDLKMCMSVTFSLVGLIGLFVYKY